ncbi:HAD-IIIA family hydrolase [Streptomyces sp. NPDC003247]|uniref:HAD-IIIA family hydrolase n=1 Tax=Streptomyces sp. NPDC003247 TaxID=3364677 RepID=UPI0036B8DAFB
MKRAAAVPAAGPGARRPVRLRPVRGRVPVGAVLFDRDGTLVEDVPYNGDPGLVRPMPGAREALGLLRARGVPTAVVSNQSGIGRGLLTDADVRRVNERADALLGGLDAWVYCPHLPDDDCACRKPRPGLVIEAARRLGVAPGACVVIGDIGADVLAARAAGARAVLVPTPATLPAEIRTAPLTAPDLLTAVHLILTSGARTDAPARAPTATGTPLTEPPGDRPPRTAGARDHTPAEPTEAPGHWPLRTTKTRDHTPTDPTQPLQAARTRDHTPAEPTEAPGDRPRQTAGAREDTAARATRAREDTAAKATGAWGGRS